MNLGAVMIYRQTDAFGFPARRCLAVPRRWPLTIDEKVRAFGEGLNTISSGKAFLQRVIVSLTIWPVIALAYREVVHSYPPEPDNTTQKHGISFLDIETVLATPELAASEVTTAVVEKGTIAPGSQDCAMSHVGDLRLVQNGKHIKNVRDHQQLRDLDISRAVLLMGFSTLGSIVQLPAVGGGSQLAVITAQQAVYGVPEMAVSCGIVLWLVTSMSCIPMGLVFARREHLSLRRLSEESTHERQGRCHSVREP